MSVVSRPLERSASSPATRFRSFEAPLLGCGLALMLTGYPALVWPGLLLSIFGWLARRRLSIQSALGPAPLLAAWSAILLGSLFGFAASANPSAAFSRLAAVVAALGVFCWLRTGVRTPTGMRLAGWVLTAACGLGSLVVLALIRGSLPDSQVTRRLGFFLSIFAGFPGVSGDVLEVNSRFPVHQYGLAYLLLILTPFLVAHAVLERGARRPGRIAAIAVALFSALLLAATEARGALIALAGALALVAGFRSRWLWGLLPAGGLALYVLLANGLINRSIEADWLNTRLSIWTRTLNMLVDYPFTGVGLGMASFAEAFAWSFGLPNPYQVVHSHDIFIQAYAEQGLLGLIGLLLLTLVGVSLAWRAAIGIRGPARATHAAVFGALIGSLLYGLTDTVPTTNFGLVLLTALIGLAAAGAELASEQAAPGEKLAGVTELRKTSIQNPDQKTETRKLKTDQVFRLLPLMGIGLLLLGVAPRWVSGLALNVGAIGLTRAVLNSGLSPDQRAQSLTVAEAALNLAVRANPLNSSALRELARVRLQRHDIAGTRAALDQAVASGNLNQYERAQLGRVYYDLGLWQPAFDLWSQSGQAALLEQAADELSAKSDFKGAAAANATLVEMYPDVSEHMSNLAKAILAAEGSVSVEEAMRWFDQASRLNPEARRSLARQVVLQAEPCRINERRGGGRFDCAVFWFGLASRIDPTYDKPEVELGAVLYYAGRAAEAADHFRTAARLDPRNSSSWHQLGQAEAAAGRLPQAVAAFEEAVRAGPNRGGLHASLGQIYARIGRCDDARRSLEQALTLEPGNALAQSELARLSECR